VVGLAKRDEELWLPGEREPVRLSRRSEALKVLQHVRDETHRFATSLNQKLRSKDLRFDTLESVDGIGPARAAVLLRVFGSLDAIAAADAGDIADACSISLAAATAARAAARLSAESRKATARAGKLKIRGRPGGGLAASLAEAALNGELAAEAPPDYGKKD
jgi:excinuclease ABC subunit C